MKKYIVIKKKDFIKEWIYKGLDDVEIFLTLVKPKTISGNHYGCAGIMGKKTYIITLEKRSDKIISDTLIHELTHVCWYMFQECNPKLRISNENLALFNEYYFWTILDLYKYFIKRIAKVL